jgi:GNAT superfamily N-acetyltransferase
LPTHPALRIMRAVPTEPPQPDVAVPDVELRVVDVDSPSARALERRHIAEMAQRYGGAGPALLDAEEYVAPHGCFVVAFVDGVAVACGGFRYLSTGVAEIKRMYVDPTVRRRGIGALILALLEDRARVSGYREAWLESGSEQPDAISLYVAADYQPRAAYGEFRDDPRSRSFSRILAN